MVEPENLKDELQKLKGVVIQYRTPLEAMRLALRLGQVMDAKQLLKQLDSVLTEPDGHIAVKEVGLLRALEKTVRTGKDVSRAYAKGEIYENVMQEQLNNITRFEDKCLRDLDDLRTEANKCRMIRDSLVLQ